MTRRSPPGDGRNLPTVPDTVSLTTSLPDRQKPEDELEAPRCRDVLQDLTAAAGSCNRPPVPPPDRLVRELNATLKTLNTSSCVRTAASVSGFDSVCFHWFNVPD